MSEVGSSPAPVSFSTVAVCTRDRAGVLDGCIESLVMMDHPPDRFEILVVDDGSTDGTPDIVRKWSERARMPLRHLRQDHQGLSVARNRAVTVGGGDLICFIDDDAIASPGWLSGMVRGADRHPEAEAFGGRLLSRIEGMAPRMCGRERLAAELDEGDEDRPVTVAKGANMAMRRAAFQRIGLFNPGLVWRGDEEDWHSRLFDAGGSLVYLPEAFAWHRRVPGDLKKLRLLRTRFGWGVARVQHMRETGNEANVRGELRKLRAHLRHARRERCFGGLMHATMRIGTLWALVRGEGRRSRTNAPSVEPPSRI